MSLKLTEFFFLPFYHFLKLPKLLEENEKSMIVKIITHYLKI